MEAGFLVSIVITIVAFMLIAGTVMRFMSNAGDKEAEILCHDSIALGVRSSFNLNGDWVGAQIKAVPVLCKTIDNKIKGNREELKQQLAEKMARCWWMFGEGRYEELLQGSKIKAFPKLLGFEELENSCFNCYNIMIDQDSIEGGPIDGNELTRYLFEHQYSKSNTSYLQYIQEQGGPGRVVLIAPVIVPNQAYTISMVPKNKEAKGFWTEASKAAGGAIVVIVVAGGVACILGALPACIVTGVVTESGAATVAGTIGAVATAKVVTAGIVAGGVAGYISASGINNMLTYVMGEREVSQVVISYSEVGQQMCGSGDIAGK